MSYAFAVEDGAANMWELDPLYRLHYEEMAERMRSLGVDVSDYNPRRDIYQNAWNSGWLVNMVLRYNGEAVGYINVYVTNDMHNFDLIAQEDTLFVRKDHRNGAGKKLVVFGLSELKKRGVKRLLLSTNTELRVAKLLKRIGFKEVAVQMAYTF